MSYCISRTVSISSDPFLCTSGCATSRRRSLLYNLPRRDFLKCSLPALGLAALGASHVFAAPMGSLLPTMNRAGDRASVPASSSSLRVGSYNVRVGTADGKTANAWDNRKEDLVALMRLIDYDVVGLQESFTAQSAYITNSLPGYALIGSIEGAEENVGVTSPICYRKSRLTPLKSGTFWLSTTPDAPGGDVWGAWSRRKVCVWALLEDRVTGKTLCFVNTHTDHKSEVARLEGTKLILRRVAEIVPAGMPIVFTGDHNCRETEAPSQAVMKVLKNALYVSETPPSGPWRSYSGWKWREKEYSAVDALKLPADVRNARKGSPDADRDADGRHKWENCGARIDYIYVSDGVKVKSYATRADSRSGTKLYPSDHFPLVAEIELSQTPNGQGK